MIKNFKETTTRNFIGRAIALVMIAVIALSLVGCSTTADNSVDPRDYVKIELEGKNTEGQVSVSIDTEAIIFDRLKEYDLTAEDRENIENSLHLVCTIKTTDGDTITRSYYAGENMGDFPVLSLKLNGASNGDKIMCTIKTYNDKLKEDYGFVYGRQEYLAEYIIGEDTAPLEEPLEIDFLQYANFKFVGCSGYAEFIWDDTAAPKTIENPIEGVTKIEVRTLPAHTSYYNQYPIEVTLYNGDSILSSDKLRYSMDIDEKIYNGNKITASLDMYTVYNFEQYGVFTDGTRSSIEVAGLVKSNSIEIINLIEFKLHKKDIYHSGMSIGYVCSDYDLIAPVDKTVPLTDNAFGIKEIIVSSDNKDDMIIVSFINPENAGETISVKINLFIDVEKFSDDETTVSGKIAIWSYDDSFDVLAKHGIVIARDEVSYTKTLE